MQTKILTNAVQLPSSSSFFKENKNNEGNKHSFADIKRWRGISRTMKKVLIFNIKFDLVVPLKSQTIFFLQKKSIYCFKSRLIVLILSIWWRNVTWRWRNVTWQCHIRSQILKLETGCPSWKSNFHAFTYVSNHHFFQFSTGLDSLSDFFTNCGVAPPANRMPTRACQPQKYTWFVSTQMTNSILLQKALIVQTCRMCYHAVYSPITIQCQTYLH